jgi:hypothetical protein
VVLAVCGVSGWAKAWHDCRSVGAKTISRDLERLQEVAVREPSMKASAKRQVKNQLGIPLDGDKRGGVANAVVIGSRRLFVPLFP